MPSSRVRTPTPSPRHRRQMREVQLPDRIYTYRPSDASAGGMAYLDPGADIHLTRLWSAPAGQFPDAPPYYREGDPPPLDTVPSASDDDPAGWRAGKKVINIGLVAVFAFVTALTAGRWPVRLPPSAHMQSPPAKQNTCSQRYSSPAPSSSRTSSAPATAPWASSPSPSSCSAAPWAPS